MMDEKQQIPVSGKITVAEAGRRGGVALKARIGRAGYMALGKLGGAATSAHYGRAHYREIGRRGGEVNVARRGRDYMREIGRRGGERSRELLEAGRRAEGEQQQR